MGFERSAIDLTSGTKRCPHCGETKRLTEFTQTQTGRRASGGWQSYCRKCDAARSRGRGASFTTEKRERLAKWLREYRREHPEVHRDSYLRSRYGISLVEYNRRLLQQQGVCAICKRPPTARKGDVLAVDHDHMTGAIRGLLCSRCNKALGFFSDSPALLRVAERYLVRQGVLPL